MIVSKTYYADTFNCESCNERATIMIRDDHGGAIRLTLCKACKDKLSGLLHNA